MDFDLKVAAARYIETFDLIPRLTKAQVESERVTKHSISIDVVKLFDMEHLLATFILEDPDLGSWLFKQLIEDELRQVHAGHFVQVAIQVVLENLPQCLRVSSFMDFPPNTRASPPFVIQAKLVGKSVKFQYAIGARFFCLHEDCLPHQRSHFVEVSYPETMSKASKRCGFCQNSLQEVLEAREVSHFVHADFVAVDKGLNFNQAISLVVRDAAINALALGQVYEIVVKVEPRIEAYECLSLTPFEYELQKWLGPTIELSSDLINLFLSCESCPWTFVQQLTLKFADHVAPKGTFHHLKMGILLSLAVSKGDPEEPSLLPLFVAVADNSDFPTRLLHYGLSLVTDAPPVDHSSVSSALISQTGGAKKGNAASQVFAGDLILAKDSVCYLGELVKYKKDALDSIKSVLESGQLYIASPNAGGCSDPQPVECYPLMSTIWTHCSINGAKSGRNRQSKQEKIKNFCSGMRPFIDVFGTLYICHEDTLATPLLLFHQLFPGEIHLDESFHQSLQMLLEQIRGRRLPMDTEASILLKKYFVASRRARRGANETLKGTEIPMKALQTITTMAEGHAKLSLCRKSVTVFDAVAAVKLYEENVVRQCGYSFIIPQENCAENYDDEPPATYNQEMMKFAANLEAFFEQFVGDLNISISINEE